MPYPVESGGLLEMTSMRLGARHGPIGSLFVYLCCLLMIGAGPALVVLALNAGEGERLPAWIGAMVVLLIILPSGLWFGASTAVARHRQRRLDIAGLPAVAEIIAVEDKDIDGESGVKVTLRLTGPGFEPFDAVVGCRPEDVLVVGGHLHALVDPDARKYFTIRR
ncbi:hypothetical protein AB0I28_06005 [Phytomonospora sp. NPDC050363]|uniref:hypothetical protein n=1 Tax=Phytomonospora sp. NPDC050363 TaxID=3155642 RepID=UPI0033FF938C